MKRTFLATCTCLALAAQATDLVWNGGNGAVWDDAAVVWLDGTAPTCWQPGATAVIPGGSLVRVIGEHTAAAVRFTGTGAVVAGGGFLHLTDGVEAGAAGTTNAVNARLLADSDGLAKTGAGCVFITDLVGTMSVTAGDVVAGGTRLENCTITPAGGTLLTADPVAYNAAANLLQDGSFELGSKGSYWNGDDRYWKIASTNKANGGWYVCRGGNGGWTGKPPPNPDGSYTVWLQGDGSIKQQVVVPADGLYDLSCWSHLRNDYYQSMAIMYVLIDGVQRGYIQTSRDSTNWLAGATGPTWLAAGTHEVMLMGERGWADTTIFLDKVMLGTPVLASSAGLAKSTATAPIATSSTQIRYLRDVLDYLCYLVLPDPAGSYTETKQLVLQKGGTKWSGLVLDVAGAMTLGQAYLRTDGNQWFYKRGAGSLTLPSTVNANAVMLQQGTLVAAKIAGGETPVYTLHDAPAKIRLDFTDSKITTGANWLRLQGSGCVEVEVIGANRTFESTGPTSFSAEHVAFNPVDATSVIRLNNLTRLTSHGAGWTTQILKKGAGTLELAGAQGDSGVITGAFTLRQGTLKVVNPDTFRPGNTLFLGDACTPASAALTATFAGASRKGQPLVVRAAGASRTITGTGTALEFGAVTLGGDLTLAAASGYVKLGAIACPAGTAAATLDASGVATLYLDGDVGTGVTLARNATGALSAGKDRAARIAIPSFALQGTAEFSFDAASNDRFDAGALALGTCAVSLRNDLSGTVFSRAGTYTLATYETLSGDVSGLSVDAASRTDGYTYAFAAADGALTLTISVDPTNPVYTWNTGSGDWNTAAAWDHLAAPNAADLTARFSDTASAVTTVTLAPAVTNTVGALAFAAQNGFTLAGGTVRFAVSSGAAAIDVAYGRHTVSSTLVNAGAEPLAVSVAAGGELTIDGDVYGDVVLSTTGVKIGPNARFHGQVTLAAGLTVGNMVLADDGTLTAARGLGWHPSGTSTYMVATGGWHQVRVDAANTNWFLTVDGAPWVADATTNAAIKTTTGYSWYGGRYLSPGPHLLTASKDLEVYLQKPGTLAYGAFALADLRNEARVECLAGAGDARAPADGVLAVRATNDLANTTFTGRIGAGKDGLYVKDGAGDFLAAGYAGGRLGVRAGALTPLATGEAIDGLTLAGGTANLIHPGTTVKGLDGTGTLRAGAYAYAEPITDETCGLSSAKTYTHAANFVRESYADTPAPVVTINGVTFTRYWNHPNVTSLAGIPGNAHYESSLPAASTAPQPGDTGLTALTRTLSLAGEVVNAFKLTGLETGKTYDFRLYFRSFSGAEKRIQRFSFIDGGVTNATIVWNPDWTAASHTVPSGFSVVGCRYVAGASGSLTVSACDLAPDLDGLHLYAFSNELLVDAVAAAEAPVALAPAAGVTNVFDGTWSGTRGLVVNGTGVQAFGAGSVLPASFAVAQGTAHLSPGAVAPGVVDVAAGAKLALQATAQAGGVSGAGTLHLAVGDADTRGAVQADGSFAASTNYPRQVFFTNDDNCGVSTHKTYDLAAALGRNGNSGVNFFAYVNGVPFAERRNANNSVGSAIYPWSGVSMTGAGSTPYSDYQHRVKIPVTESCWNLIMAGNYCPRDSDVKITFHDIEPGVDYEARIYERARDGAGGVDQRWVYFAYDVGGENGARRIEVALDRRDCASFYVACRFTAASNKFQIVTRNVKAGQAEPFLYGVSLERVAPNERVLCVSNDCAFAGLVTGVGELRKTGPARQTFTGALAAASGWTVAEGELYVENADAVLHSVCVEGGTFGGTCTVAGDLGVKAGGTLAPGALAVNGRCVVAGDLDYTVAGGQAGCLTVAGDVTLADGLTLRLDGEKLKRCTLVKTTGGTLTCDPSTWTVTGTSPRLKSICFSNTGTALMAVRGATTVFVR